MIEKEPQDWRELQARVAAILTECGMQTEIEKAVMTARGAVEIDVYAVDSHRAPPLAYVCECKHWRARVQQAVVHSFRTVLADCGAHCGLLISMAGFQAGAKRVAQHTNIRLLTWRDFQELFMERWLTTFWVPTLRDGVGCLTNVCCHGPEQRHGHLREPTQAERGVGLFALEMWGPPFHSVGPNKRGESGFSDPQWFTKLHSVIPSNLRSRGVYDLAAAVWCRREFYKEMLPARAQRAEHLRDLLGDLLDTASQWREQCRTPLSGHRSDG